MFCLIATLGNHLGAGFKLKTRPVRTCFELYTADCGYTEACRVVFACLKSPFLLSEMYMTSVESLEIVGVVQLLPYLASK
jgi:hypothetical protein